MNAMLAKEAAEYTRAERKAVVRPILDIVLLSAEGHSAANFFMKNHIVKIHPPVSAIQSIVPVNNVRKSDMFNVAQYCPANIAAVEMSPIINPAVPARFHNDFFSVISIILC